MQTQPRRNMNTGNYWQFVLQREKRQYWPIFDSSLFLCYRYIVVTLFNEFFPVITTELCYQVIRVILWDNEIPINTTVKRICNIRSLLFSTHVWYYHCIYCLSVLFPLSIYMIVTVSAPNIPDSALKVTVSALWKKLYVNTCPNGTLNYKLVKIGNYPFRHIIKTNSTQSNRIIQINYVQPFRHYCSAFSFLNKLY